MLIVILHAINSFCLGWVICSVMMNWKNGVSDRKDIALMIVLIEVVLAGAWYI